MYIYVYIYQFFCTSCATTLYISQIFVILVDFINLDIWKCGIKRIAENSGDQKILPHYFQSNDVWPLSI